MNEAYMHLGVSVSSYLVYINLSELIPGCSSMLPCVLIVFLRPFTVRWAGSYTTECGAQVKFVCAVAWTGDLA